MKVIGAGFGRTGTLSIKAALEELGFGPCYHQFEVGKNPAHPRIWAAAARGESVDWKELFKGYRSTVDWPGCAYYKELMEAFPDAKVLLSVREPERWYESTLLSIYSVSKAMHDLRQVVPPSPKLSAATGEKQGGVTKSRIWDGTFSGRFEDREYAIGVFNRHIEEVKGHVPPDRLLVYEVKEGWAPLCEFLGVGVPEGKPFPRLNDSTAYLDLPMARRARAEGQWEPATLRSALAVPEHFASKLHGSASIVKKNVWRHLAGQAAKARSYLKRAEGAARG